MPLSARKFVPFSVLDPKNPEPQTLKPTFGPSAERQAETPLCEGVAGLRPATPSHNTVFFVFGRMVVEGEGGGPEHPPSHPSPGSLRNGGGRGEGEHLTGWASPGGGGGRGGVYAVLFRRRPSRETAFFSKKKILVFSF